MASNWVKFRDSVVDALNIDEVTEDMKQGLTKWLLETAYPLAESAANSFITQTREQAANEVGWCKVRDLVVLPFIINGGLWLIEKALSKSNENA